MGGPAYDEAGQEALRDGLQDGGRNHVDAQLGPPGSENLLTCCYGQYSANQAPACHSPDHAGLELTNGVGAGVLQRHLCRHGELPSSEEEARGGLK